MRGHLTFFACISSQPWKSLVFTQSALREKIETARSSVSSSCTRPHSPHRCGGGTFEVFSNYLPKRSARLLLAEVLMRYVSRINPLLNPHRSTLFLRNAERHWFVLRKYMNTPKDYPFEISQPQQWKGMCCAGVLWEENRWILLCFRRVLSPYSEFFSATRAAGTAVYSQKHCIGTNITRHLLCSILPDSLEKSCFSTYLSYSK